MGFHRAVTTVEDAPLAVHITQNSFYTNVGRAFRGWFAGFDDGAFDPKGEFSATISWGDGQESAGTIRQFDEPYNLNYNPNSTDGWYPGYQIGGAGRFMIYGEHAYAGEGNYPVTVTVEDTKGGETASRTVGVHVYAAMPSTPAPGPNPDIAVTVAVPEEAVEGTVIEGVIATFTDGATGSAASGYGTMIDWGDGSYSSGWNAAGDFTVSGSHVYTDSGAYAVKVWVYRHPSGYYYGPNYGWTPGGGGIEITEAPLDAIGLTGQLAPVDANRGEPLEDVVLATVSSQDATVTAADLTARVAWGDGTVEWTEVVDGDGGFEVRGSHTYLTDGRLPLLVDVFDMKALPAPATPLYWQAEARFRSSRSFAGTAVVTAAVPVLVEPTPALTFVAGVASGTTVLAAMTLPDSSPPAGDYTAVIHWGDGATSAGQVAAVTGGLTVSGSHTYAVPGNYRTLVVVSRAGRGALLRAENEVTVAPNPAGGGPADPAVVLTVTSVGHVEGDVLPEGESRAFTLGELRVTDPLWDAAAARVTIDWGDGRTSVARLTPLSPAPGLPGRRYSVTGSHRYERAGSYVITLSVDHPCPTDAGSPYLAVARSSATISDHALSGDGVDVTAAAGNHSSSYTNWYGGYSWYGGQYGAWWTGQGVHPWGPFALGASNATVATFTTANPDERGFQAIINWGDGAVTGGTVAGGGGSFQVFGSHDFWRPGTYRGEVTIIDTISSVTIPFTVSVRLTPIRSNTSSGFVFNHRLTLGGVVPQACFDLAARRLAQASGSQKSSCSLAGASILGSSVNRSRR